MILAALTRLSGCTLDDIARACDMTPTQAHRELRRLRIHPYRDGLYRAPKLRRVSPALLAAVKVVCDRGKPLNIKEAARQVGYNEQSVRRALRVLGWSSPGGAGSVWSAP